MDIGGILVILLGVVIIAVTSWLLARRAKIGVRCTPDICDLDDDVDYGCSDLQQNRGRFSI